MNDSNSSARSFEIYSQTDVAFAALEARKYAETIGFKKTEQYMISTAVSELARNIINYAETGVIQLNVVNEDLKTGMEVLAEDSGPGIGDIEKAMEEEFSTGGTLGVGLPGTKRMMDSFEIESQPGLGTKITIRKWLK